MAKNARSTRDVVLERIRKANGDGPSKVFTAAPDMDWNELPRAYQRVGQLAPAERNALFAERMEDYNAGVYHSNAEDVRAKIGEVLQQRGKNVIVVPDLFPEEWVPVGIRIVAEKDFAAAGVADQENVITLCTVAIAATGTVVLQHGDGEGARQLSLLPDYHLCLVRESQVVETVPEAFTAMAASATRQTTFISGPSATADIEMTRIKGVHGPRFLDVILVR